MKRVPDPRRRPTFDMPKVSNMPSHIIQTQRPRFHSHGQTTATMPARSRGAAPSRTRRRAAASFIMCGPSWVRMVDSGAPHPPVGTPPPPAAPPNRRGPRCSQRRWEDRNGGGRPPLGATAAARRLASRPALHCRSSRGRSWDPGRAATPLGQGGGVHCRRASRCPVARCRPRIGRFGDRRKVRPDGGSPHGPLALDRPSCHRSRSPSCTYFHRQWCGMTGWREPQGGPHAACGDLNLVDPVPASRAPPGGVAGEHHARRAGRLATGRRRPLQARATAGYACDAALRRRGWGVPAGRAVPAAPCCQGPPRLLAGISVRCRRGPIKSRSEEARGSRLSRPHRSPASAPRPRRTRLATRVRPVPDGAHPRAAPPDRDEVYLCGGGSCGHACADQRCGRRSDATSPPGNDAPPTPYHDATTAWRTTA